VSALEQSRRPWWQRIRLEPGDACQPPLEVIRGVLNGMTRDQLTNLIADLWIFRPDVVEGALLDESRRAAHFGRPHVRRPVHVHGTELGGWCT